MLTCLYNVVGYALLGSMCLCVYFHDIWLDPCIHTHICLVSCSSMPMCLNLYSLHALCYLPCACVLHAMIMCLGLDLVCHVMCYCGHFVHFIAFSCVLAYWFGLDLDLMVFVIVHTPWSTSKGLDHPFFMSMLACFYALCLC